MVFKLGYHNYDKLYHISNIDNIKNGTNKTRQNAWAAMRKDKNQSITTADKYVKNKEKKMKKKKKKINKSKANHEFIRSLKVA
jgi:ABC-type lipoprotein release transport system permease subunit